MFNVGDYVKVKYAKKDSHLIGKVCKIIQKENDLVWVEGGFSHWDIKGSGLESVTSKGEKAKLKNVKIPKI